jgi:hypothetical protein
MQLGIKRSVMSWLMSGLLASFLGVALLGQALAQAKESSEDSLVHEELSLEWFVGTEDGKSEWLGETQYSDKILAQAFEFALAQNYGGCSNGEIRFAQNVCRGAHGSRSRGVHYCHRVGGGVFEWACAVAW